MTFTIHQTRTTPFAEFKDGCLVIRGKSVPFNYPEIFDTIQDRMSAYMKEPEENTRIDITLSAINATSKRSLIKIFQLFEEMNKQGIKISINWYYESDDEDVYEMGEICKNNFNVNMQLSEID